MTEFRRLDMVTLPTSMHRDKDGFLVGEAVVTRTGVFLYKNSDGSIRRELRHPHDVFSAASLDTLKMIPIASLHPPEAFITVENAKDRQVGQTGENIRIDGNVVILPIKITHKDAIEQVENGMRELSLGYTIQRIEESGNWDGEEFDIRQSVIRYNHLAIVPDGRAGIARLNLDATDAVITDDDKSQTKPGGKDMPEPKKLPTVVVDGISYEATQEVINALEKHTKRADAAEEQLKAFSDITLDEEKKTVGKADAATITAFQTLQGEKDALQKKLDEAEKKFNDEAIQDAVKVRIGFVETAKKVLDEDTIKKLDTMSNLDIQKEIIVQSVSDEKEREELRATLKDATDAYVQGSYAVAAKSIPDGKTIPGEQRRQIIGDRADTTDDKKDVRTAEDARQDMIDRNGKAWLGKTEEKAA